MGISIATTLRGALGGIALAGLATSACATAGRPFVWVDEVTEAAPESTAHGYVIHRGDLLSVKVLGQDGMSSHVRVRDDGRISLLFLNDVDAAGLGPATLADQIQTRLKDYLTHPVVSVAVEEVKLLDMPVLGEVTHPGTYPVVPGSGVLQALAAAGGLTDFAHSDRIFVLRPMPAPTRIRFRYLDLTTAAGRAASFALHPGDVVVVE